MPPAKRSKTYMCGKTGCGKAFDSPSWLKRHELTHTGHKQFKCPFLECGRAFARADALDVHIRTHTSEKPYDCKHPDCGASFAQSGELTNHERTHTGERPYKCRYSDCDEAFAQSGTRDRHERTHSGDKPFKCRFSDCCSVFADGSSLTKHERSHTGERPFVCDYPDCGRAFAESGNLTVHKRRHTGERPYECTHPGCMAAFAQSHDLTKHMRTHTGDKPYRCTHDGCDYASATSGGLAGHIESNHSPEGIGRKKHQEVRVERALLAAGYEIVGLGDASPPAGCFSREHRINFRCIEQTLTWATIDFVVTLRNGQLVLLEVDENQHRFGYGEAGCDMRRISRVKESLTIGGLTDGMHVVRYNPQGFKVAGETVRTLKKTREARLIEVLDELAQTRLEDGELRVWYMYYDLASVDAERPNVCSDPDFNAALAEVTRAI
jgi:hypothetical protein